MYGAYEDGPLQVPHRRKAEGERDDQQEEIRLARGYVERVNERVTARRRERNSR